MGNLHTNNKALLTVFKPVCYGILEPDGKLYMSESCICRDKEPLRDEVLECAPEGSRIVKLYVKNSSGRRRHSRSN